jgi:IMP cyclohydrolase
MFREIAERNAANLKKNVYPGRGIVIGATRDCKKLVQIYWIMGRSENSRNRVFVYDSGFVRTKAFDESKVTDPSLIIYYPIKDFAHIHIVSNGDQTETILDYIKRGKGFTKSMMTREFEPDPPNFTPRIAGIVNLNGINAYTLSILKTQDGNSDYCVRYFYQYEKPIPGYGHCIHTYMGDGNPLPSFCGEPYIMQIPDDADRACQYYWSLLNEENRVSLLAKYIDTGTGESEIKIINKHC